MSVPRPRSRRRDDRGVTLVLLALCMTALLVMAAILVDLGGARQQKRRLSTSADAASLGAAQELISTSAAASRADALVRQNMELGSGWCTSGDPTPLAIPAGSCISFDGASSQVRVYIPREYATSFGGVIGARSLKVSGAAVAQKATKGAGVVLPFGVTGGGQGEYCLKEPPQGELPPANTANCQGATAGNFHYIDSPQYGNGSLGTVRRCTNGHVNERLENNMAIGIDHELSIWNGVEPGVLDHYDCSRPKPDTMNLETGTINNQFDFAMRRALPGDSRIDDRKGARLGDLRTPYPTAVIAGVRIDDKPLWEFVPNTTLPDVPTSCQRSTFTNRLSSPAGRTSEQKATAMRSALRQCFTDYGTGGSAVGCTNTPCKGVVFGLNSTTSDRPDLYDIQYTPRFAYAPRFASFPAGASGTEHIRGPSFAPLYLQRLFGGCGGPSCSIDFEPGVGFNNVGTGGADGITSFVFHNTMLPGRLGDPGAPFELNVNKFIELVK